mmetsp:Transcript_32523/g.127548  ORF Transcript_32523/g.127548 Transcript_32523/m.127548 type:complete len:105 (+) Transcript_32523:786-1100(+)
MAHSAGNARRRPAQGINGSGSVGREYRCNVSSSSSWSKILAWTCPAQGVSVAAGQVIDLVGRAVLAKRLTLVAILIFQAQGDQAILKNINVLTSTKAKPADLCL